MNAAASTSEGRRRNSLPIAFIGPAQLEQNPFVGMFSRAVSDSGIDVRPLVWRQVGWKRVDLIILHWPDNFFKGGKALSNLKDLIRLWKARLWDGTKIIWVAHNSRPHESGESRSVFRKLFTRSLSGVIFLSRYSVDEVKNDVSFSKKVQFLITKHGKYSSEGARDLAPAEEVRLLFFGLIRPYKNIETLISAFGDAKLPSCRLKIIGKVESPEYREIIVNASKNHRNIDLDLRDFYLSDDVIENEIDKSDGVILPYKKILNSGSVIHALSRYRPVLAPDMGSFLEVQQSVGSQWVKLFTPNLSSGDIEDFVRGIRAAEDGYPHLGDYDWIHIIRDLSEYWKLLELRK
jgi:glycosyltransferase involved in cell wall biosynthesis